MTPKLSESPTHENNAESSNNYKTLKTEEDIAKEMVAIEEIKTKKIHLA